MSADLDIDDIVQEAYVRVLKARETSVIASPKAFLFATARNLVYGQVRRRKIVGGEFLAEIDALCVLDESGDIPGKVAHAEELELLTLAVQSLPARCRQILTLRKIYGVSQKEIARQFGISEHTVEAQGTIGMRRIADFFERIERQSSTRYE